MATEAAHGGHPARDATEMAYREPTQGMFPGKAAAFSNELAITGKITAIHYFAKGFCTPQAEAL